MIPYPYLLEWQEKVGWPSLAQVEQDLLLSRILIEIYSHPFLKEHLVFRGGTALHKLFLSPAGRYSEDLDFVQIKAGPIGPILQELRKTIDPWLGKSKWKLSEGRATLYYRFIPEEETFQTMRIKIEINTREHFHFLSLPDISYQSENSWFSGEACIRTYALEELLGTKLRALYQRKKGRDLFDLHMVLNQHPSLDTQKVIECFSLYMAHESQMVSRAEFQMNMAQKLGDGLFCGDISPLLRAGHAYDPQEALQLVEERIFNLLVGAPWKGTVNSSV